MKTIAPTMPRELVRSRARLADYLELTKPRLNLLVLVTTLAGFYLGSKHSFNLVLLVNTLIGTALVAAGASALNQLIERGADARMHRTEARPLPSGRVEPIEAFWFGASISVAGMLYLTATVNLLTSQLAALTWLCYLFVYTPMKTQSPVNTLVGAIPGAIPPMIGWTAVRDHVSAEALVLFGILFLWQFPHFLAIAWMYREDYSRGGFKMLPLVDPEGKLTGRYMAGLAFALVLVSLLPTALGMAGMTYLVGATALGAVFVALSCCCLFLGVQNHARRLFFASVIYLPLLLALMTLDKV